MAITRGNSFEAGLASGTAITNAAGGNSGGVAGDYLNAVFASANNSIQYHTTRMHGSLSAKLESAGGGSASIGYDWKDVEGTPKDTTAMRGYFRFTSMHEGNTVIMQARGAEGGSTGFFVRYNVEKKLQVLGAAGNVILATTAAALALNVWYRIEFRVTRQGEWALRVYNGDTYTLATAEISGTDANSGMAAGFTFWRWAQDGSAVNALSHIDDVAYADDWIGPVPQTESRAVSAVGAGWLAQGAVGLVVGISDTSDTTFAESPNLSSIYQPLVARIAELGPGDIQIQVRLSGDGQPTARIRLMQGTGVVCFWTAVDVPATPTDYTFTVGVSDIAKVTNRAELRVEVAGIV